MTVSGVIAVEWDAASVITFKDGKMSEKATLSMRDKVEAIKNALRETIHNLESVVEEGERALKRAKEQLDRFD